MSNISYCETIQLLEVFGVTYSPEDKFEVDYVNGKKEGPAKVKSKKGIILAELNFHYDKLHDLCIFYDHDGEREKEVMFTNGIQNGWYCEYEESEPINMRIFRNGAEWSELRKHLGGGGYFEEIRNGNIISICKFNRNRKKNGLCWFLESDLNHKVLEYNNGVMKQVIYIFDGERMIAYNENEDVIYVGGYSGDIVKGFETSGVGRRISYDLGRIKRVDFLNNGRMIGYQEFDIMMREYDQVGRLVYEGEYEGNEIDGFTRNGIWYTSNDNVEVFEYGRFRNGVLEKKIGEGICDVIIEMDNDNRAVYIGGYVVLNGKIAKNGRGKSFRYDGVLVKEIYHCENGEQSYRQYSFDDGKMTIYKDNGSKEYEGMFQGDVYLGYWREGEGEEYDNTCNVVYRGHWRRNKKEGFGRFFHQGNLVYKGHWKNDKPNGNGALLDRGDEEYRGEWDNGYLRVNEGWVYFEDGKIYEEKIRIERNRHPIENGVFYEGERRDGCPNGFGIVVNSNGEVLFEGSWTNGLLLLNDDCLKAALVKDGEVHVFRKNGNIKEKCVWNQKIIVIRRAGEWNSLSCVVTDLHIGEDCCNDLEGELRISNYPLLESIVIEKNALQNLSKLAVKGNRCLKRFETCDSDDFWLSACRKVKEVELVGNIMK